MARKKKSVEPVPVAPQMTRDPQLEQLYKEIELGTVEPMEREDLLDLVGLALDAQKYKEEVESLSKDLTNAEEDATQARAGRDELHDQIDDLEDTVRKKDEECEQLKDKCYRLESLLTFVQYQHSANETAVYPGKGTITGLMYGSLGLTGEAGEVAEKVKKLWRDKDGKLASEDIANIQKELGDVLWYINAIAGECGLTLESVAQGNIDKLNARKANGTLQGSGDNR